MESYGFLMDLALILISTKVLGLITKRIQMPQVVGALLAGLILGPAMLNILQETEFISQVSELGVIVLMFTAGLETDIQELKKAGAKSFVIALIGVIVPLIGGFGVSYFFNREMMSDVTSSLFLQNVFIGVILTATSVSITVETLKELGRLNTAAGNAILGAAVIDDILGIIALTVVTTFAGTDVSVISVLLKIVAFFVIAAVCGVLFYFAFNKWMNHYNRDKRRFVIVAFVFCLLLSYVAEVYFGVADITGAYLAGLIISDTSRTKYIASRFEVVSYMLLSPMFFASIGIEVVLPEMSTNLILFAVSLVIVAVLTKVVGCGLGAKMCGYTKQESLQIGVGMVSRGEVALVVASKGAAVGLMSATYFGPVVIVVVATTILAPILLKLVFKKDTSPVQDSGPESLSSSMTLDYWSGEY
jgi:Kef-type K+ transport system membrane component KefB